MCLHFERVLIYTNFQSAFDVKGQNHCNTFFTYCLPVPNTQFFARKNLKFCWGRTKTNILAKCTIGEKMGHLCPEFFNCRVTERPYVHTKGNQM